MSADEFAREVARDAIAEGRHEDARRILARVGVVLDVLGSPAPKGSGRAMLMRGKAVHVPNGSAANGRALKSWDRAVREIANDACGVQTAPIFVGVPLELVIVFRMQRPSGHYSKKAAGGLLANAPRAPITKPDVDKLTRSTVDSLTGIVYDDDSKIVALCVCKEFASPGHEGARIVVREWSAT